MLVGRAQVVFPPLTSLVTWSRDRGLPLALVSLGQPGHIMTDLPHINGVATYTTMSLKVAKRHLSPQPSPYMTLVATLSDLLSDINHNKTHPRQLTSSITHTIPPEPRQHRTPLHHFIVIACVLDFSRLVRGGCGLNHAFADPINACFRRVAAHAYA